MSQICFKVFQKKKEVEGVGRDKQDQPKAGACGSRW